MQRVRDATVERVTDPPSCPKPTDDPTQSIERNRREAKRTSSERHKQK